MRYLFVLAILCFAFTAHAQPSSENAKWEAYEAYAADLAKKVEANKITERQAALASIEKLDELKLSVPLLERFLAHRAMLAGRVERKEISEDEARYLDAKERAEIMQQVDAMEASKRQTRQPAPMVSGSTAQPVFVPIPMPAQTPFYLPRAPAPPIRYDSPVRPQTNCRPNGIGGFVCQ